MIEKSTLPEADVIIGDNWTDLDEDQYVAVSHEQANNASSAVQAASHVTTFGSQVGEAMQGDTSSASQEVSTQRAANFSDHGATHSNRALGAGMIAQAIANFKTSVNSTVAKYNTVWNQTKTQAVAEEWPQQKLSDAHDQLVSEHKDEVSSLAGDFKSANDSLEQEFAAGTEPTVPPTMPTSPAGEAAPQMGVPPEIGQQMQQMLGSAGQMLQHTPGSDVINPAMQSLMQAVGGGGNGDVPLTPDALDTLLSGQSDGSGGDDMGKLVSDVSSDDAGSDGAGGADSSTDPSHVVTASQHDFSEAPSPSEKPVSAAPPSSGTMPTTHLSADHDNPVSAQSTGGTGGIPSTGTAQNVSSTTPTAATAPSGDSGVQAPVASASSVDGGGAPTSSYSGGSGDAGSSSGGHGGGGQSSAAPQQPTVSDTSTGTQLSSSSAPTTLSGSALHSPGAGGFAAPVAAGGGMGAGMGAMPMGGGMGTAPMGGGMGPVGGMGPMGGVGTVGAAAPSFPATSAPLPPTPAPAMGAAPAAAPASTPMSSMSPSPAGSAVGAGSAVAGAGSAAPVPSSRVDASGGVGVPAGSPAGAVPFPAVVPSPGKGTVYHSSSPFTTADRQGATVLNAVLSGFSRRGVTTLAAVALMESGFAVFCTVDGLGLVPEGAYLPLNVVPLSEYRNINGNFRRDMTGNMRPGDVLKLASDLELIGKPAAIISTGHDVLAGVTRITPDMLAGAPHLETPITRDMLEHISPDIVTTALAEAKTEWDVESVSLDDAVLNLQQTWWETVDNPEAVTALVAYMLADAQSCLENGKPEEAAYVLKQLGNIPKTSG